MSFDQSAIKELKRSEEVKHVSDQLQDTFVPAAAVPSSVSIESLEQFQAGRVRFRGTMTTSVIAEYAAYVLEQECKECFVDMEGMTATTFFNLGDVLNPGHGDHKAVLCLSKTSAFKELLSMNGCKVAQKTLAEWLEDWRDFITSHDQDGQLLPMTKAIAAIRRITIKASAQSTHSDSDFSSTRSAMEQVEAQMAERQPSKFFFKCVPYEGLKEREFELRLSVATGGEKPMLTLRIIRLEKQNEDIALEFKDTLTNALDDTPVRIGKFALGS
ncbi:MAG: DUF2303 family protein [Pontibacterium sp.]